MIFQISVWAAYILLSFVSTIAFYEARRRSPARLSTYVLVVIAGFAASGIAIWGFALAISRISGGDPYPLVLTFSFLWFLGAAFDPAAKCGEIFYTIPE